VGQLGKDKDQGDSTGKRIKNRIKELGRKQPGVAKEADISPEYLHNVKSGQSKPSVRTLARLAKALRTSIDKLRGKKRDK